MTNALDVDRLRTSLRETLLAHRTASGGWAYVAGKTPRIEPTSWALLALADSPDALDAGPLERWPRKDGWLVDVAGAPPNYAFNALAGLALLAGRRTRAATGPLASRIVAGQSIKTPPTDLVQRLRDRIRFPARDAIVLRFQDWRRLFLVFGGVMSGLLVLITVARAFFHLVGRRHF